MTKILDIPDDQTVNLESPHESLLFVTSKPSNFGSFAVWCASAFFIITCGLMFGVGQVVDSINDFTSTITKLGELITFNVNFPILLLNVWLALLAVGFGIAGLITGRSRGYGIANAVAALIIVSATFIVGLIIF